MNTIYTKAKEKLLTGQINWLSDTIKVALVDSAAYTPNPSTDEFLAGITSGAIVATSDPLAGKSATQGIADADDLTIAGVTGSQFEYLVIYKDTGSASTSPLICLIDTATNLPFTPTGGSLTLQFDNGSSKIFSL